MSNYEDVYAPDLTEETESTLSGSEQFVMFDSVEGKRAELSTIADYIVANGEIDGSDIPTIVSTIEGNIGTLDTKVGDLAELDTEDKDNLVAAINEAYGKAEDADAHVGDLSELHTTSKVSVVSAVNEINGKADTVDAHVGDLSDLDTTDKTSIVSAMNEVNGKAEDADAKADTVDEHVGDLSELETENKTSAVDAINEVLSKIPVMTKEVTGNPIVIDDALNADVISLGVELEPVQEGSGTPSPTNVRPITGHDSVTVTDTGINQWDEEMELGYIDVDTGAYIDNTNNLRTKNKIPVFPSTSYYIALNKSVSGNIGAIYYDKNEQLISSEISPIKRAYTTPSGCRYMAFFVPVSWYGNTYTNDISVNLPSTDTAYHAYHGQSKTVTLPHTVYGGDVDVTGGAGTEKMATVDLGTLNWGYSSADARFYYNGIDYMRPASATDVANAVCTIYPIVKFGSLSDASMCLYTNGYAYVKDSRYTDAASFKTAMSGVYLCYELATPTALSTTPTDITLYNGDNTVSADGDMGMVYVRDIVKVIEKLEG